MMKLLERYQNILIYLSCSVFTALIEMAIGWNLLKILPNIVVTNTVAIIISSIIHYFITLKFVFGQKNSVGNVAIYVGTFIFGIFLQDFVIDVFYNFIMVGASEFIRYFISKIVSLAIPFVVLYLLRSFLYGKFNDKNEEVGK